MNDDQLPSWIKAGTHVLAHGVNDDYIGVVDSFLPGRCVALKNAYWVRESGRLNVFMREGKTPNMELEWVGNHIHHWEGITEWPHPMPTEPTYSPTR